MISRIEPNWGAEHISEPLYVDQDENEIEEVVIITKAEAIALVEFLKDEWLDRDIANLNDAVQRLQKGIE